MFDQLIKNELRVSMCQEREALEPTAGCTSAVQNVRIMDILALM